MQNLLLAIVCTSVKNSSKDFFQSERITHTCEQITTFTCLLEARLFTLYFSCSSAQFEPGSLSYSVTIEATVSRSKKSLILAKRVYNLVEREARTHHVNRAWSQPDAKFDVPQPAVQAFSSGARMFCSRKRMLKLSPQHLPLGLLSLLSLIFLGHIKDGGYNSTKINRQLSPAQNTPALQATLEASTDSSTRWRS